MANYPEVAISMVQNTWTRQMHFLNKGDQETQHKHEFDHVTLLANGSLDVTVNGKTTTFKAPHMIFIKKDEIHSMIALEDNTVAYCIHSITEKNVGKYMDDIVYPDMVPEGTKDQINFN
jgi:quercetin dioxygenase-like cupin family protein